MKILMITTSYPRWKDDYIGIFVEGLSKPLVENGNEVYVIAPGHEDSKNSEILDGVNIKRVKYWFTQKGQKLAYGAGIPTNIKKSFLAKIQIPFLVIAMFFRGIKYARKSDIIHVHWPIAGIVGILFKKLFRKKYIVTVYGVEVYVGKFTFLVKSILKNADYVIYISNYTKSRTPIRKSENSESVISLGIDHVRFNPLIRNNNPREKLGISDTDKIIFSIGRLIERKGFPYLIKAMKIMIEKYPDIKLIIGGKGPEMDNLVELIHELKLNENIQMIGYIESELLPYYYASADVFVIPSIIDSSGDTEGLGLVTVEAMACETPVIGSNVGGITDVIDDEETGFLVEQKNSEEIADKIIFYLDNPEKARQFGIAGAKKAREIFNWETYTRKTIEIYRKVLTSKKKQTWNIL